MKEGSLEIATEENRMSLIEQIAGLKAELDQMPVSDPKHKALASRLTRLEHELTALEKQLGYDLGRAA